MFHLSRILSRVLWWRCMPSLPSDDRVLFACRARDSVAFPFLSNFFYAPFELDGMTWPTVEHYYQSQKSDNSEFKKKILKKRPLVRQKPEGGRELNLSVLSRPYYGGGFAKRVGDSRIGDPRIQKQSWFKRHPEDLRPDWGEIKLGVMWKAINAKFSQNPKLKRLLMATESAVLIEESTSDPFWGSGKDGLGQNWLGVLLMELRSSLDVGELWDEPPCVCQLVDPRYNRAGEHIIAALGTQARMDALCAKVKNTNDIVGVIEERIPVKLYDTRLKALCPFHQEKTPSFTISHKWQNYHCFGCDAGGDVFHFIMEYEKVDFPMAVKMLADRAGVIIDDSTYSELLLWSEMRDSGSE